MLISTFYKENADGPRAEVHQGSNGYFIEYYDARGLMIRRDEFDNKSIQYVANMAENWAQGYKVLNG